MIDQAVVPEPSTQALGQAPEAFSINFARHTLFSPRVRLGLAFLTAGYLLAGAVCGCFLVGLTVWTGVDAARLQQRVGSDVQSEAGQASRQAMVDLQAQAAFDATQLNAVSAQLTPRFPVAAKLAALTVTLPARTWVTGLAANRTTRTLTIQAAYLIDPEHPYELPATPWIQALKADPQFGAGLKRLDLQGSSRTTQGRSELFLFTLSAEWTPLS